MDRLIGDGTGISTGCSSFRQMLESSISLNPS
jgi:hypothetical protein